MGIYIHTYLHHTKIANKNVACDGQQTPIKDSAPSLPYLLSTSEREIPREILRLQGHTLVYGPVVMLETAKQQ